MTALATTSTLLTTDDLLSFPEDDGFERWLIRGQLRERAMTKRNRWHSRVLIRLGRFLDEWLDSQPAPRGEIVGGEAGVRLTTSPDSTVGIDLAFIGPEVAGHRSTKSTLFDGPPILAVEILSPTDQQKDLQEKIREYLRCGVKLVWIVDPYFQTITVYQHDAEPVLFNSTQTITAEPYLPGFVQQVARVFE